MTRHGARAGDNPCLGGTIVTLARSGRPPLRFRGCLVARTASTSACGMIEVCLWKRGSGLVVSLHIDFGPIARREAIAVADLEAALDLLERLPVSMTGGETGRVRSARRAAEALGAQARARSVSDRLAELVGDAAATWSPGSKAECGHGADRLRPPDPR